MNKADAGWFEVRVEGASPGDAYSFVLPDGRAVPDPVSRAQVGEVDGPSRLVEPDAYTWRHERPERDWESAVICEMHLGTFTAAGTFAAAAEKLPHLKETGFTAVEIMPVAQFPGNRGWGYDGVLPYAPHPAYGTPEEMKAFIDAAHEHGLMVLLDVVYNHFGPEGNFLPLYAGDFFDESRHTPWGAAIAYEKTPVREFFIRNALYWIGEFRLDGLRLDAIDHVRDPSEPEILIEIAQRVRAAFGEGVHLTTEDNRNITMLHERGPDGSVPLHTAEWNDDLHNVVHVIATGESDGYYKDFLEGHWEMLARALAEGFAYQGQISPQMGEARGHPSGHLPPVAFVDFLQNHDQIGNRAFGERLNRLAPPEMVHAMTAMLLLSPHIPLMFMGEEYGETRPFLFFTDFHGELADAVRDGRRREFADFSAFAGHEENLSKIPDPNAPETFQACKLDWDRAAGPEGAAVHEHVRHLLSLRREHVVPHLAGTQPHCGTVLSYAEGALAVDWRLNGAALKLRASLGMGASELPAAEGELIYATHDRGPGDSPWVTIHLQREV